MASKTEEGARIDIYDDSGQFRSAVIGRYQTGQQALEYNADLDLGSPECVTWIAVGPDIGSANEAARQASASEMVEDDEEPPSECCTYTSSSVTIVETVDGKPQAKAGYRVIMMEGEFSESPQSPMYTASRLVAISPKQWSDNHQLKPLWDFQTRLARHIFAGTRGATST